MLIYEPLIYQLKRIIFPETSTAWIEIERFKNTGMCLLIDSI